MRQDKATNHAGPGPFITPEQEMQMLRQQIRGVAGDLRSIVSDYQNFLAVKGESIPFRLLRLADILEEKPGSALEIISPADHKD